MKHKRVYGFLGIVGCIVGYGILHFSSAFFNTAMISPENRLTTGEWVPAETVVSLQREEVVYSNAESVTSYIDQSGEQFQLVVQPETNQYLSFEYTVTSNETAHHFDTPAVVVLIGGTPVLQIEHSVAPTNSEWQQATIDIPRLHFDPGVYDIQFTTQNTYDELNPPTLEIREVTTTQFFAKPGDRVLLRTNKPVRSVFVGHTIWENNQNVEIQAEAESVPNTNQQEWIYVVPNSFSGLELEYWSFDLFENSEARKSQFVLFESSIGVTNIESDFFVETDHEMTVQLSYKNNSTTAHYFLVKSSVEPILSQQHWDEATAVQQKQYQQYAFAGIPTLSNFGNVQKNIVLEGLPTGTQYLTVHMCTSTTFCEAIITNQLIEYPL